MKYTKQTAAVDAAGAAVTAEQLAAINKLTRRALTADEVYLFSVILCDNEVDRDMERFGDEALDALGSLFVGKTGIFDHNPTAGNQSARIFATQVVAEAGRANSLGQPYRCLKGWAYLLRCEKNHDLMLEIDGGIKKEVSVSCAVKEVRCSVCGADQRAGGCNHQKGQRYGEAVCHHLLCQPTDAYEWSFVAVPAQRAAGVTKQWREDETGENPVTLAKLFDAAGAVTLTKAQLDGLRREYRALHAMADAGKAHLEALRREVVKLALVCQPALDPAVMEEVAAGMDLRQLQAFSKAYRKEAERHMPMPQLAGTGEDAGAADAMAAFRL